MVVIGWVSSVTVDLIGSLNFVAVDLSVVSVRVADLVASASSVGFVSKSFLPKSNGGSDILICTFKPVDKCGTVRGWVVGVG